MVYCDVLWIYVAPPNHHAQQPILDLRLSASCSLRGARREALILVRLSSIGVVVTIYVALLQYLYSSRKSYIFPEGDQPKYGRGLRSLKFLCLGVLYPVTW